jgi:hypothetical protein
MTQMVKRTVLLAAFLAPLGPGDTKAQEDVNSANWVLPGCRAFASNDYSANSFKAGVCAGVVSALAFGVSNHFGYCVPAGVTNSQAVQVAFAYLTRHPDRLHERFNMLTIDALREAWPCR